MSRGKRAARWALNLVIAGCLVGGGYTAAHLAQSGPSAPSHPTHETPAKTVDVSPRFVKA